MALSGPLLDFVVPRKRSLRQLNSFDFGPFQPGKSLVAKKLQNSYYNVELN